jgi:glyoxylase-like metal-dependent hydrolase (beta-lactamase superfamily II)
VAAEFIAPGVRAIVQGYVSAFLVEDEEGVTLVDAGLPGRAAALRRALDEAGGPARLRHVVLTHHHVDHTGGLAALLGGLQGEVTVWAHAADARVIRGDTPPPRPPGRSPLERAAIAAIARFGPKAPPARVDREVADGETVPAGGGLVAVHTPGHTAGHVSWLLPARRLLFVGDAAANILGRVGPPFGVFTEDHAEVVRSIAKLAALEFEVACFGHGRVLRGGAAAAFRRLAERLARRA